MSIGNFALSESLKLATYVLIPHWVRVEGAIHCELLSNFNIPQGPIGPAIGILGVVHKPPCIRRVGAEVLSILPPRHCLQGGQIPVEEAFASPSAVPCRLACPWLIHPSSWESFVMDPLLSFRLSPKFCPHRDTGTGESATTPFCPSLCMC